MDGSVAALPAYKTSVNKETNTGAKVTQRSHRDLLAFQFLDFIIVEPFQFTAQVYIVWVFHVSAISIRFSNQVFNFPAEENHFAYAASKLTGRARISGEFRIVKPVLL